MVVAGTYDAYLVALSFAVAAFASYTALDLGGRIRNSMGWATVAWLATAAVAMGGGIWSMHFIAMLAFLMPMPVQYEVGLTVMSLVVAIVVTGGGFYFIGTRQATPLQLVLSGLFMGLGIVSMHYIGMAAMRMPAELRYDQLLVALSVFIAIGASIAALWLAFKTGPAWQRVGAAILMGVAISGMHYTGMTAAVFTDHARVDHAHGAATMAQTNMALAVAGVTFLILMLALVASSFDRRFAVMAERETLLLRASEEQFRNLYRDTPLPLHAVGPDGRIAQVSDAWLALIGYRPDDVIGRRISDFMTEPSRRDYEDRIWPRLQRGEEISDVEVELVKKSGDVLDVLLSARGELSEGTFVHSLGGLVDVTARKRAESALEQSQRMEAIGQLTGGVAHDFNNLLMVISGATEKLRRSRLGADTDRPLEMIQTAVKRGQTLTSHLLSFARRQTLETTVIDLAEALPSLGELLKRSLRGDIEIRTSIQECPCRIRVDPGEFELAVLNLAVNARDAMPDGGILSLSVRRTRLSGQPETDRLGGDFVVIALTDTGAGIPADVLPRVFDPFFTTKSAGKGTGLGLSQVYGFAKQSEGTATIESRPGRGTTVCLYLPATDEVPAVEKPKPRTEKEAGARRGTVLLVEDSPEVASVSADYLEQLGYDVECVPSGAEALTKLQKQRFYELVLSDILMPGSVGGLELARIVRQYHPETPILLATGYSEKAQEAVHEGCPILSKPFDLADLAGAIRELRAEPGDAKAPMRSAS